MPRILTAFVKLPQKKRTFLGVNGFYLSGRYDIISQVCGQLCRTAGLNVFPERVPAPRMAPFDQGVSEKSKISSISTNTARFCVKKPWNPQRIPAALCLKSCLCLRNIRHFLCFQIHLNMQCRNVRQVRPTLESRGSHHCRMLWGQGRHHSAPAGGSHRQCQAP